MPSLRNEARRLGTNSLLYLVPNLLLRGLTFLLTPLYTRHMSVDEYGVVSLCTTVSGLLGVVLGFAISSSINRLHHEHESEAERRKLYGTVTGFILVVPVAIAAVLHVLGTMGLFDRLFDGVPFRPFLAYALWTAVLNLFPGVATERFATREEPKGIAVMNLLIAAVQAAVTVLYVVVWNEGAAGAILAGLISAGFAAAISLVVLLRSSALGVSFPLLRVALLYSIPLVPHALSQWALSVSDRIILERHVSKADLGRYSLGYLFSFVALLFVQSINNATAPAVTRRLKADPKDPQVPRLGTMVIAAMTLPALGAATLGGDAIHLIAPPSYHAATAVVPWVVLGALMMGVYTVAGQGTWFSMNTRAIPVVTALGAGSNVVLNLIFVPRFGIMAAAVNTAASYALLAIMHGMLAHRLFPIAWEFRKWALILGSAIACYALTTLLPDAWPRAFNITLRTLATVALFPALLLGLRVFSLEEVRRARGR